MSTRALVHPTAIVDDGCTLGDGVKVWAFCHVSAGATIGDGSSIGEGVFIGEGVQIGAGVKIQNHVSVYAGVTVEDDVFIGPSAVFTNVSNPRAAVIRRHMYEPTLVRRGATIGANATVVCGVTIGRHAFVGAGAVVTQSIDDYVLAIGIPARPFGWMSRHGHKLAGADDEPMVCVESGLRYVIDAGRCRCVDLHEDAPLPESSRVGAVRYRERAR